MDKLLSLFLSVNALQIR